MIADYETSHNNRLQPENTHISQTPKPINSSKTPRIRMPSITNREIKDSKPSRKRVCPTNALPCDTPSSLEWTSPSLESPLTTTSRSKPGIGSKEPLNEASLNKKVFEKEISHVPQLFYNDLFESLFKSSLN